MNSEKWSAVLIDVDTQNDFMLPVGALYVPNASEIVGNLGRLIDWAERTGVPVISTVDSHASDDPEFKEFPVHCVSGTWGNQKIAETTLSLYRLVGADELEWVEEETIEPDEVFERRPQVVFEKRTVGVFDNPRLEKFLAAMSADRFIVCGVAVDYCVGAVVEKLIELGKTVWLVVDATGAIDSAKGDALLKEFEDRGVKLVTGETVISE
jgi:nicotinamidase-related amidase